MPGGRVESEISHLSLLTQRMRQKEVKMKPVLYFVIPCYNEEETLPVTFPVFLKKLMQLEQGGKIHRNSRILFVDDGSTDKTWNLIQEYTKREACVAGLLQSRNRGQQSSILAGLMEALKYADLAVTMDCDGQDDIEAVDRMLKEYEKGVDIVYGVRSDRGPDRFGKKAGAKLFYSVMHWMGAETIAQHGEFRLVSARVLKALSDFKEVNLFLRGIFPLVGFKSTSIYYERKERAAGKTHYTLKKMLRLAADGITGFTIRPIRIITFLGIGISVFGFLSVIWAVLMYFLGRTVDGWASMMCITAFLGGIQLLSLGIIGEYIGKIYLEAKGRPRYIIAEKAGEEHLKKKGTDKSG